MSDKFAALALSMSQPREDAEYYFVELYATEDGRVQTATMTQWVGWEDMDKRWERRSRIVRRSSTGACPVAHQHGAASIGR
jgi:hypothetical protein